MLPKQPAVAIAATLCDVRRSALRAGPRLPGAGAADL